MLGHALRADDYGPILTNRELGFVGFLRLLFAADHGEHRWANWRPARASPCWLLLHATARFWVLAAGRHEVRLHRAFTVA